MRLCILAAPILLCVMAGCSGEDSSGTAAGDVSAPAPAAAAPAQATPEAAHLDQVQQAIQQRNYVGAADILAQTQPAVQKFNDDERARYRQQLMATTQALLQAGDDPQARAAYERLGRAVTGR